VELETLIIFLLIVAVAAAVQTITGFALGLVLVAVTTAVNLVEISYSAAVIAIISMSHAAIALRRSYRQVQSQIFRPLLYGLIPSLLVGYQLLDYLSGENDIMLRYILGLMVIVAGSLMMVKPMVLAVQSKSHVSVWVGLLGGVFGGLYSAAGAPIAYYLYRQPMTIISIRSTLLAIFLVSTGLRTVIAGFSGHLTIEVLATALFSLPVVIITTLVAEKILPAIPDRLIRKLVFLVLISLGFSLLVQPGSFA
jgi:uncharacterized membrane protein YfcA